MTCEQEHENKSSVIVIVMVIVKVVMGMSREFLGMCLEPDSDEFGHLNFSAPYFVKCEYL